MSSLLASPMHATARTILRAICAFFCVVATGSIATAADFPDPNLEAAIRGAIDKPTGPIYETDLEGLSTLAVFYRDICTYESARVRRAKAEGAGMRGTGRFSSWLFYPSDVPTTTTRVGLPYL